MKAPGSLTNDASAVQRGGLVLHAPKRQWGLLWIVLFLGAAYLLTNALALPFRVIADGSEYLQMAQHLLSQHSFTYDGVNPVVGKPPGFPFLIAVYLKCFGSLHGFQFVLLLLMLGCFLLLAAATGRLLGLKWAVGLLGFLVAMFPLNYLVGNLLSEPAFLFLSSIGMLALINATESENRWNLVIAGSAFGLATYFRTITLFWPFALVLLAGVFCRDRWRRFLPVLMIHLILVAPWIYRNWSQFKSVVPMVANWAPLYYLTEGELWKTYFYEGSAVVRDLPEHKAILGGEFEFNWKPGERFKAKALQNIAREPLGYLGRCVRQSLFAWTYLPGTKQMYGESPSVFLLGRFAMFVFYSLGVLGLLSLWKTRKEIVVILVGYTLYTAVVLFPVCTESRYLIPAYMWLLPLPFAGVRLLIGKWHRGTGR